MASTVARRSSAEELENRRRMVLELVRSRKSTTLKELADSVDTRPAAVAYDIRALQKDYPEIVHPKGSGKVYWTGVEEVKTFDRYPLTKNGEGYPDPTAAPTLMDDSTTEVIVEKAMENKTNLVKVNIIDERPEGYLTVKETARIWDVQPVTVRQYYHRGQINEPDAVKIGDNLFIKEGAKRPGKR